MYIDHLIVNVLGEKPEYVNKSIGFDRPYIALMFRKRSNRVSMSDVKALKWP